MLTGLGALHCSVAGTSTEMLEGNTGFGLVYFGFLKGFAKGNLWEFKNVCISPENDPALWNCGFCEMINCGVGSEKVC